MNAHHQNKSLIKVTPQLNLVSISAKKNIKKFSSATRVKHKSLFTGEKEKILFKLINSKVAENNKKILKTEEKSLNVLKNNSENCYNPSSNIQEFRFVNSASKYSNSPSYFYPNFNLVGSTNPHNAEKFRVVPRKKKKGNLPEINSALMISKKKMTPAASTRDHYLSF